MDFITTEAELDAIYGEPPPAAMAKVASIITPTYRRWIEQSRFCVIATSGPGGCDGSPRGDDGPVARLLDERHIAIPDWIGNNRIDSLRNLMHDPQIALMFMVAGSNNVVRVNGEGRVTRDAALGDSFARTNAAGTLMPRTVLIVRVTEVYMQCSRALLRSRLWDGRKPPEGLPSQGEMLAAQSDEFEAVSYDEGWAVRSLANLW